MLTGKGAVWRDQVGAGRPLPAEFPPRTVVHEVLAAFASFLLAREARQKQAA